jgi:hypothetical protein
MRFNDIPEFKESRRICRSRSIESELNNQRLLREIYTEVFARIGISPQPIELDLFTEKGGEVVLSFAAANKINSTKVILLVSSMDKLTACRIIGRTAVCLMETYSLLSCGPRIA